MSGDLDASRQQVVYWADQLTKAQATVEPLATERDSLQAEWDEARTTIVQLAGDLEDARRQIAQLNHQLAEKGAEIARLQANVGTGRDQVERQPQVHTAYCLTCRTHRVIEEACEIVMPDGRRAAKGRCAVCGARLLNLIPSH